MAACVGKSTFGRLGHWALGGLSAAARPGAGGLGPPPRLFARPSAAHAASPVAAAPSGGTAAGAGTTFRPAAALWGVAAAPAGLCMPPLGAAAMGAMRRWRRAEPSDGAAQAAVRPQRATTAAAGGAGGAHGLLGLGAGSLPLAPVTGRRGRCSARLPGRRIRSQKSCAHAVTIIDPTPDDALLPDLGMPRMEAAPPLCAGPVGAVCPWVLYAAPAAPESAGSGGCRGCAGRGGGP